jgi:dTDP-4-amino-4,6-dideoxygalactose transaminase
MSTGPVLDRLASQGGTPVRSNFLPLAVPWIGEREQELVRETLASGWITTGPRSLLLAKRVAEIGGAKHGLALNSATAALHLALVALGVKRGDEVVTSPYTFAACVNVIEHVGATPVLADVEADSLCMDPKALAAAVTPRTKAILPVDYAGHPCDMDGILEVANRHGIPVVEDAAHALGAAWGDQPVGSRATVTAYSFYATKNLTTGEGGAAVSNDENLIERMGLLSLHGMSRDAWMRYGDKGSWYYEVTAPGYKYNLSDVLAAIGIGQLERFDEFQKIRRDRVMRYHARLSQIPEIGLPTVRPGLTHAWHLYTIALDLDRLTIDRAKFIQELRAENIGTSVHFIPIHLHPHFASSFGLREGMFPVTENAYRRAISLPLFPRMSEQDVDDVCAAVAKIVAHYRR